MNHHSAVPQDAPPGAAPRPGASWAHFEHRADIGVRGTGPSREAAFEQAALALTAVVTPPERVMPHHRVELACEAADDESLLVAWLNALVYEMAVRRMLFSRFQVVIDGQHLRASAWGEPVSVPRHRPAVEIKGATFTGLRVAPDTHGAWLAQTVVDV
ncbi:MAG: archease [Comamonadaceae bacterium]|jgi:SHS2 domain-containing protein|nr:archease [Comamonadaceae bacterium]